MILKHSFVNLAPNDNDGGSPAEPITPPSTPTPSPSPKTGGALEPRTPSKEELEVEFKDDLVEVAAEPTKLEEKKQEPKKEEPKKEEPKPIVPPVVTTPKAEPKQKSPVELQPILPPSATPKSRDYSGFTDEEQKVLKAMSNEAFDYVSKALKEKKDLEKLKNASFLQHPSAFVLDPGYQKLQEDTSYFRREADYWKQQLIAIEAGNDWAPIIGWNEDGSPRLGPTQPASSDAKIQVGLAMNQCFNAVQQTQNQLQQFTQGYQQRIQQDTNEIQQECARRFGWVADPKLLDATVEVPGAGLKTIKQIREDFVQLFPPYLQNTIGIDVGAHMFAAMQCLGAKIRELENGKHVAEIKAEEVTRAEPTSDIKPTAKGKTIGGVTEFSLEGMPT